LHLAGPMMKWTDLVLPCLLWVVVASAPHPLQDELMLQLDRGAPTPPGPTKVGGREPEEVVPRKAPEKPSRKEPKQEDKPPAVEMKPDQAKDTGKKEVPGGKVGSKKPLEKIVTADSNDPDVPMKIFIYPLPSRFNVDWVNQQHTNNAMVEFEVQLERMIRDSPHFTSSINHASHFLVPAYSVAFCGAEKKREGSDGCTRSRKFLQDAVEYVQSNYPQQWERHNGRDHLVMGGYDWGTCFTTMEADSEKMGRPEFLGDARSIGFLGDVGANPGNCFRQGDIVLPPYVPQTTRSLLEDTRMQPEAPQTTVYFRGTPSTNPQRRQLLDIFAADADSIVSGEKVSTDQFAQEMHKSQFCLVPPGFAPWSFRFSESILAGCLPIVTAPKESMALACESNVNYDKFTVFTEDGDPTFIKDKIAEVQKDAKFMAQAMASIRTARPVYEYGAVTMGCLANQIKQS